MSYDLRQYLIHCDLTGASCLIENSKVDRRICSISDRPVTQKNVRRRFDYLTGISLHKPPLYLYARLNKLSAGTQNPFKTFISFELLGNSELLPGDYNFWGVTRVLKLVGRDIVVYSCLEFHISEFHTTHQRLNNAQDSVSVKPHRTVFQ